MKLKYFDLAKQLSKKSLHHKHKLGAVIVFKNKVLGLGINKLKTNPKSNHPFRTVHAELDALLSSRDIPKGSELYIYREKKDGSLGRSYPCMYCIELIKASGIKKIYFTDDTGYKEEKVG